MLLHLQNPIDFPLLNLYLKELSSYSPLSVTVTELLLLIVSAKLVFNFITSVKRALPLPPN